MRLFNKTKAKKKIQRSENIKVKVVIYFLIGFLSNILGVILGLLWLKFKAKTFRKKKLIALLIGFGINILYNIILTPYVLQPIMQPQIDQAFFKEHPDAGAVTKTIQSKYPDAKIFVRIDQNTLNYNGQVTTTTIFTVQHRSTELLLTGKEMHDIAKQTCAILEDHGTSYDKVQIFSLKYTLPLKLAEVHRGIKKPCNDWETKNFSDVFPN